MDDAEWDAELEAELQRQLDEFGPVDADDPEEDDSSAGEPGDNHLKESAYLTEAVGSAHTPLRSSSFLPSSPVAQSPLPTSPTAQPQDFVSAQIEELRKIFEDPDTTPLAAVEETLCGARQETEEVGRRLSEDRRTRLEAEKRQGEKGNAETVEIGNAAEELGLNANELGNADKEELQGLILQALSGKGPWEEEEGEEELKKEQVEGKGTKDGVLQAAPAAPPSLLFVPESASPEPPDDGLQRAAEMEGGAGGTVDISPVDAESLEAKERLLSLEAERQRIAQEAEEQERKLEAARLATLAEHVRREELERQEEGRRREEMAMFSEELRLSEFYDWERGREREEKRALAKEDRATAKLRAWELAEIAREKAEAERVEREKQERLEAARRRAAEQEQEHKEGRRMAKEDKRSTELREYTLRLERERAETQAMGRADREAFASREAEQAATVADREKAEGDRMGAEDAAGEELRAWERLTRASWTSSSQQRGGEPLLGSSLPSSPGSRSRRAAEDTWLPLPPPSLARSQAETGKVDPKTEPLGKLLMPPPLPSAALASSAVSSRLPDTGVTQLTSRPGSAPAPSILRLWKDLGEEKEKGSTRPEVSEQKSSGAAGLKTLNCGGPLCNALLQARDGWKAATEARVAGWLQVDSVALDAADIKAAEAAVAAGRTKTAAAGTTDPADSSSDEGERLLLFHESAMGISFDEMVRLEVKLEGLKVVPALNFAPALRVLSLIGNAISSLAPLVACTAPLEELNVSQNRIGPNLRGVEGLAWLRVLIASVNNISDASALSELRGLRHLDLAKNHLEQMPLLSDPKRPSRLSKLVLYRNKLAGDARFLQELGSLTHLDLGRNRLTALDGRISTWCPLLGKLVLYENRIESLPELELPLLTELWVNGNQLAALGPLGFLPSLEQLHANNNQVVALGRPLATSPGLRTVTLSFNNLLRLDDATEALTDFLGLRQLQLNDNPVQGELLLRYRSAVLERLPQLEEFENEPVTPEERASALRTHLLQSRADLPQHLARCPLQPTYDAPEQSAGPTAAVATPSSQHQSPSSPSSAVQKNAALKGGLLGLLRTHNGTDGGVGGEGRGGGAGVRLASCAATTAELLDVFRRRGVGHHHHCSGAGACAGCGLGAWCQALSQERQTLLVAQAREERKGNAGGGALNSRGMQLQGRPNPIRLPTTIHCSL